ncbi:MAG TPA: M23 family metallopeptidase [Candidatus Acidoferrales bacterium]|jgi:murein DD-endopeptidase MepM/ murein hydrolase activator NlpD|nr:M23 family metallopeptidase [Candidatus Acidoferrales bacterium]
MKIPSKLVFLFIAALGSLSLAGASLGQAVDSAHGIEGVWAGVLTGQLRWVLTITRSGSGELGGTIESVDQHAVLALSNVTLRGDAVRFEVPRLGGVYEGRLKKNGREISGSWTQTGTAAQALDFMRSAESGEAPGGTADGTANETSASAQAVPKAEHTPKPLLLGFNVVIPIAPSAFKADGKWHLVYELQIANMDRWEYAFTRIEVVSADAAQKTLATFSGADLDGMFIHPGLPNAEKVSKLAAGEFGAVFLWVTFDKLEDIPSAIAERISAKVGDYPEALSIVTPPTSVEKNPVVVISSPLVGEDWEAGNGPSNTSLHRRALIPIDGHAYISQRLAIDWVQAYPDGKTYKGDPSDNKNYRAYGAEIHAVADGVVTQMGDGIPQNTPGAKSLAVPITLETVGGNHVIMEIGNGLFAFYAHMQPGSLRVKVGDKVRRGQVLGLLGNTGNSSEPHLHFQICNANSELGSEGLPYAFVSFEVQGKAGVDSLSMFPGGPVKHEMEIPTEDEIVRFSGGGK